MSGWISVARGWGENPALDIGPHDRRSAWLWLIENACWRPTKFNIGGKTILLERGQLCVSRSQLSKAWDWSDSAVERFLTRLKTEQMIGQDAGQGRSVITICNYSKYQDFSDNAGQQSGQQSGQRSDSGRTAKEQGNKGTKEQVAAREPESLEAASDQRSPPDVRRDPEIADYRQRPQPPAMAKPGSATRDPRMREVANEVMRLVRMTAPPSDMTRVDDWMKAGADPEKHIYPTVERLSGGGKTIGVFKYFEAAVLEVVDAENRAHDAKIAYFERVGREAWEGMTPQEIEARKRHIEADKIRMERERVSAGATR